MRSAFRTIHRDTTWVRLTMATVVAVLVLLVAVSANVQPAEWDPTHMHIVVGGSDVDKAHALAAHLARMRLHPETDGRAAPIAHTGHTDRSCADPSDDHTKVLSIRAGEAVGLAVFGGGAALAGVESPAFAPPPEYGSQVLPLVPLAAPDPPLALPEPPPRAS